MKEVTEQGAYLQLAQLCARSEHCQHELTEKMRRWDMSDEAQARVMARLVGEHYVEVGADEYLSVLRPLLQQKRRSVKADSDYELNQKLVKFALSRGFTYDIIRQCISGDIDDVDEED